jgi:hypothetical protein
MKRIAMIVIALACWAACARVDADWSVADKGTWPESWPKELEPLRGQSRSATGSLVNRTFYEIPFKDRAQFEAAWPHILSQKTKGAPIILRSSPDSMLGSSIKAGVRIFEALPSTKENKFAGKPIPGATHPGERWLYTTYIELIVDGDVVDLNRIPLPSDESPIIDKRFEKPAAPPREQKTH